MLVSTTSARLMPQRRVRSGKEFETGDKINFPDDLTPTSNSPKTVKSHRVRKAVFTASKSWRYSDCSLSNTVTPATLCPEPAQDSVEEPNSLCVGGTGLRPVVSGVTPETVMQRTIVSSTTNYLPATSITKFGGTPNLTGGTPVPPKTKPPPARPEGGF